MDAAKKYVADASFGVCSCPEGRHGKSDVNIESGSEGASSLVQSFCQQFSDNHAKFGSGAAGIQGLKRMVSRMAGVKSEAQWLKFLMQADGCTPMQRQRGAIRVQPTSLARRKEGVTRGSKRRPCVRPPNADSKQRKAKRPRNLGYNVSQNQPNAKSHGEGH